ncbi:hypothetical protein ACH4FX_12360 [Streptomyces sp. NPDC018019]|uniref:hypothetical protein n=1 Tax=Streptomyces sp. NPDC018019 TaxID=3365030 RepID=UPI0037946108
MSDHSAAQTDVLVSSFLLREFLEVARESVGSVSRWRRRQVSDDARHLAGCPTAKVVGQEAGVDTSDPDCGYATLTAVIGCEHGREHEFAYGDFGDLADLIARVVDEESRRLAQREERRP